MSSGNRENISVMTEDFLVVDLLLRDCSSMLISRPEHRSRNYYRWRRRWLSAWRFGSIPRVVEGHKVSYDFTEEETNTEDHYATDEDDDDNHQYISGRNESQHKSVSSKKYEE